MTELERALVALGRELDLPPTPPLARAVRARIGRRRRSWLVVTLATVLLALAIAIAVPQARTAILRLFHIGAVRVERVDTLPQARFAPLTAGLGGRRTRDEAERVAGFQARVGRYPAPSTWWAEDHILATVLEPQHVLLIELAGTHVELAKKFVEPGARVAPASVGRSLALWIAGRHAIALGRGRLTRYSGNALVWARGDRTFRLEGESSLAAALRDARTITP